MKCRVLSFMLLCGFLLGVYEGKVAIWKDGEPHPSQVFPYSVSNLPDSDRKTLEKGIYFHSKAQIFKFITDYLS